MLCFPCLRTVPYSLPVPPPSLSCGVDPFGAPALSCGGVKLGFLPLGCWLPRSGRYDFRISLILVFFFESFIFLLRFKKLDEAAFVRPHECAFRLRDWFYELSL